MSSNYLHRARGVCALIFQENLRNSAEIALKTKLNLRYDYIDSKIYFQKLISIDLN